MTRGRARQMSAIAAAAALLAALAASAPAHAPSEPRDREQGSAKRTCDSARTRPPVRLCLRGGRGAAPGKRVRYRFGVRNRGAVPALDVKVVVRLPEQLEHVRGGRSRARSRRVVISLGRLRPGQGRSRAMVARVRRGTRGERIVVRARVTLRSAARRPPAG